MEGSQEGKSKLCKGRHSNSFAGRSTVPCCLVCRLRVAGIVLLCLTPPMKMPPSLQCGMACVSAFAAFAVVFTASPLRAAELRTVPGLGLKLMPIPAGTFSMGKTGRVDIDGPQTDVTISRPFWLGRTEVTHAQWRELMATDLIEQARRMLADDTLYTLQGKQQTARDFYKQ